MNNNQKKLTFFWVLIPSLLLSALIHTTDPYVGGLQGLTSAAILLSVFVFSLPMLGVVGLVVMGYSGMLSERPAPLDTISILPISGCWGVNKKFNTLISTTPL